MDEARGEQLEVGFDAHDPDRGLRRLQFSDGHLGWITSKYSSCRAIMGDSRFSHFPLRPLGGDDGGFTAALSGPESAGDFLRNDGEQHIRLRRMATGDFTVRAVAKHQVAMERFARERLDAMEEAGSPVDFVQTFALPVASLTLCDLLGVPARDRHRFEEPTEILDDIHGTTPEQKREAIQDRYDFVWSVVEERRVHPGDDVVSKVVAAGDLSDTELKGFVSFLFAAGHSTTALAFTVIVFFLLSEPDRWEAARKDPAALGKTIEELLRYLNPVNILMPRTALEDVEIDGVEIKAGETVAIVTGRPSGDLEACPHLRGFSPSHDSRGHLAFGHGRHMCLGQHLARLELRVGLNALMHHFPTLHLGAPVEEICWYSDDGLPFNPKAAIGADPLPVGWQ